MDFRPCDGNGKRLSYFSATISENFILFLQVMLFLKKYKGPYYVVIEELSSELVPKTMSLLQLLSTRTNFVRK